jgi:hypothetical protein
VAVARWMSRCPKTSEGAYSFRMTSDNLTGSPGSTRLVNSLQQASTNKDGKTYIL